jgi:hypothetical protein
MTTGERVFEVVRGLGDGDLTTRQLMRAFVEAGLMRRDLTPRAAAARFNRLIKLHNRWCEEHGQVGHVLVGFGPDGEMTIYSD